MSTFFLSVFTLLQREIWRFLRQKNRIMGAVGTPLLFWLFIGSGFRHAFNFEINYLQYFFPGTIVLVLLFTSIFSTISVIEDRREGFLQGVLVAPVSRAAIVLGNLLGGTILAVGQGLFFLVLTPLLGIKFGVLDFMFISTVLFFMAFGLTGLGFLFAWRSESTQGFHAIINLFLMPLWLLSGAVFPLQTAPDWMKLAMKLNPLTYSVAALHHGFYHETSTFQAFLPSPSLCLLGTILFGGLMFLAALFVSRNRG